MPGNSAHTKLFNETVHRDFLPLIGLDGWRKLTAKRFGRLEKGVYQWLAIAHDDRGLPRILVEYGAMPLVIRCEFENMNVGGRFWDASHQWKSIADEQAVGTTVERICSEWSTRVRSWMTDTVSAEGFRRAVQSKTHPNTGHDDFGIACMLMDEGASAESLAWFERARQVFVEAYRANPYAKWADEHAGLCTLALQEIAAGRGAELCARWKRVTYEALKLEKHFGPMTA